MRGEWSDGDWYGDAHYSGPTGTVGRRSIRRGPEDPVGFRSRWLSTRPASRVYCQGVDAPGNGYRTHPYLSDLERDEFVRVTGSSGRTSSPAWSDGGQHSVHIWSVARCQAEVFGVGDAPLTGLDWSLAGDRYVDAERLGVTGGSCGGFMTNWIVGHSDRFAAAVTQRSIVNQVSFFGTSDIGPECTEGETGANPFVDLEAIWRQSPIAYVDRIHTPLLIIHSDEDHRCPLEQAEQLFAALHWLGRDVELVVFEGASHGLSRGGRPGNRIERLQRILGWFGCHLGTQPL